MVVTTLRLLCYSDVGVDVTRLDKIERQKNSVNKIKKSKKIMFVKNIKDGRKKER
jgi:hypothetical protein